MKKRFNLIFILLLGLVMIFTLVACNQSTKDPGKLPNLPGEGNSSVGNLPANASAGLKFSFPIEMSSIFNSIYVDEFELSEYVHYSVVYYSADGAVLREVPYGSVISDMIVEEDKPLLKVAGHHKIHVIAELDNHTTASGVFDLHLKNRGAISLAKYTFMLEDMNNKGSYAYPYFGTMNADQDQVTVSLEKGVAFNSWEEFTRAFQLHINGRALSYVNAEKATTKYSATNFTPFTVTGDEIFRIAFTDDVIRVTFDINLPEYAVLKEGVDEKDDPKKVFGESGKYGNSTAQRNLGYAEQPANEEIDLYHGYTFAGWFNKANGLLWRFSSTVGAENLNLEAHWVLTEYSFTVYTMGGVFVDGLENYELKINGHIVNESNVSLPEIDMNLIESSSRFSLSNNELNRITFTGFKYNMDYEKCVAMVTINSKGDKVMLKLSDIYAPKTRERNDVMQVLTKGGDSLVIDELYSDFQCTNPVDRGEGKVNDEQPVTYVKWVFNEPDTAVSNYDELYLSRISNYITNVVFKDGYSTIAGGIRLDQINDWSVNELIIPAEIRVFNKNENAYETLPIIEISERALSNAKAITKLDLSRAVNLTTIGAEAFAHDVYLADIVFPNLANNRIKNIGDRAFYDTAYEDKFALNHDGAEFIVIGTMIYKYVGEDRATVDLSDPENYYPSNDGKMDKYNDELGKITSIEAGAFSLCPSLETLKLPYTVTTIRNNALSGLENFRELIINAMPSAAVAADGDGEGGETPDPTEPTEPAEKEELCLLLDIGETAFEGTPFLSESGNLYVPEAGAVLIGHVYYRFLNKNATTADIPAKSHGYVITHIAARAFKDCAKIERVTFGSNNENEKNIESIGKNAFTDTAILKLNKENENKPTLYTVFNHILTDYYGNLQDPNGVNLVIPDDVHTIATNAFGQYGRYFETVQIGANVTSIENYAFSGANMLTKVILTGVAVNDGDVKTMLVGAPSIGEYAFADADGALRSGMKIYFNKEVIDLLESYVTKDITPRDIVTAEWVNLYKLHKEVFEEEGIGTVTINKEKIASVMMQTTPGVYVSGEPYILPFEDTFGRSVADALIITSKTNVTRYDSLSIDENKLALILLQDPATVSENDKFANCYVENGTVKYNYSNLWKSSWSKNPEAKHYVLYYTYAAAPQQCMVKPTDDVFIVTVYDAIANTPNFTELSSTYATNAVFKDMADGDDEKDANACINVDETSLTDRTVKFWFAGLDGEVDGASLPTYYTSYQGFKNGNYSSVVFHYIDVNGVHRTIAPSRINNLNTAAEGNEFTAQIEVNFYGIGTFIFKYRYAVKVSQYNGIVQTKAINIPVNANASEYLRGYPVNLVGEDGNVTPVNISSNVFSHIDRFNTSTLGMYSAKIEYTDIDATESLSLTVYYTVVLEADEDMFTYAILKDPFGDEQGEAAITGFNPTVVNEARKDDITTLVLPSKCLITAKNLFTGENETHEYKITQIGAMNTANGIFEGMESLTAVYLPETLECIGVSTFAKCKNLKYVYTAVQAESTAITLDKKEYFTPFGNRYTERGTDENGKPVEWIIQPVKLISVGTLDGSITDLIIASDYKLSDLTGGEETEEDNVDKIIYRIVSVEIEQTVGLKYGQNDVYLPDTVFRPYKVEEDPNKEVKPYRIKDMDNFDITPFFYKSGNNFMIKTQNHAPANLVTIGKSAFSGCTDLESINLTYATSLRDIGAMAFSGSGLKSIDLSKNTQVTKIHSGLFDGCTVLEKVVLHSGITEICERAFKMCYSLSTIEGTLNNLTFIGEMAFNQATSLTRFDLYNEGGKLKTIQSGAFAQCVALTIYCHFAKTDDGWNSSNCPIVWNCDTNEIASDNSIYYIENGVRYALSQDTGKATVARQAFVLGGDIVIPPSITYKGKTYEVIAISDEAFVDNTNIMSVTVSSKLQTIGSKAFSGCTELILFMFSDSNGLETIKSNAFDGCTSLAEKPQISGVATEEDEA